MGCSFSHKQICCIGKATDASEILDLESCIYCVFQHFGLSILQPQNKNVTLESAGVFHRFCIFFFIERVAVTPALNIYSQIFVFTEGTGAKKNIPTSFVNTANLLLMKVFINEKYKTLTLQSPQSSDLTFAK